MHKTPFLLAIEGIDGAGKTTLAASIQRELSRCELSVVKSKEPTQGKFGQQLRASAATGRMNPTEELQLLLADRREHIEQVVSPALANGSVVILDRYYFSNAAYQGAEGIEWQFILKQNEAFAPRADLVLLLDVDPVVGLQRIDSRGDLANYFERPDTLARCRAIFNDIQRAEIKKIDASPSADDVLRQALQHFVVAFTDKARQVHGFSITAAEEVAPLLKGAYGTY